jgi:hypothetical protein
MRILSLPRYILVCVTIALLFTNCKKDSIEQPKGTYSKGVFVVNEGTQSVSTSISCFNPDSMKVYNDIFESVNQLPLGSYAQSINSANNKYYIMVGGSNKVEVVNQSDFKSITTITGLHKPRYFLSVNSQKAYVSQWGDNGKTGTIAIIDLTNNTIKSTIAGVGKGTEKMLLLNNKVYAVNAGGYDNDSTIVVVDPSTDAITKRINVGYNPNSIVVDKNGLIWVLCSGYTNLDTWSQIKPGALVAIDSATNEVTKTLSFAELVSPTSLTINATKDQLVYLYNKAVYQQDITATTLTTTAKINRWFYHIGIDPSSNILYATDPGDYSSNGKLLRYNASFNKIDSCTVGIGAGELFFHN